MSWWVYLEDEDGHPVEVERFQEGGCQPIGGITQAELNITYNYSWFYYKFLDKELGLKALDGQLARDWIDKLQAVVDALDGCPDDPDWTYWAPTPEHARRPLVRLLGWAKQYPDARFRVS